MSDDSNLTRCNPLCRVDFVTYTITDPLTGEDHDMLGCPERHCPSWSQGPHLNRAGDGDPWMGYLAIKAACEESFDGFPDPYAELRRRLGLA